jgi:anti-sigma-K factor RskA
MAEGDPGLAAAIARWEDRLAPLASVVPPLAAPPDLWDRLELAIAPASTVVSIAAARPVARTWRSVGFWQASTGAALALAAAFAGMAVVQKPAPPAAPIYIADIAPIGGSTAPAITPPAERMQRAGGPSLALAGQEAGPSAQVSAASAPPRSAQQAAAPSVQSSAAGSSLPTAPLAGRSAGGGGTPGFMAVSLRDGSIMIKPTAPVKVASGKDLELWAMPPGASRPVALGVLTTDGMRVAAPALMQPDTKLMVSLEPKGGSIIGEPTGPVLFSGTLARVE